MGIWLDPISLICHLLFGSGLYSRARFFLRPIPLQELCSSSNKTQGRNHSFRCFLSILASL